MSVAIYNVFDSEDNDITYLYESQLATETSPLKTFIFIRLSRALFAST